MSWLDLIVYLHYVLHITHRCSSITRVGQLGNELQVLDYSSGEGVLEWREGSVGVVTGIWVHTGSPPAV